MICFNKRIILYLIVALFSAVLSFINIETHPTFNIDGTVYLWGAYLYQLQGFSATMHFYSWPFYSMTLVWLSHFTGLSLLHAAYCFNIIFSIGISILFVRLVGFLNESFSIQCWAALVILSWHELNGLRSEIVRDHGYWFFLLVGIYFLLKFIQKFKFFYAILWSMSTIIAMLYRIDGIVLLILQPFLVFFLQNRHFMQKIIMYVKLNILTGIGSLIFLAHFIFYGMHNTGRLGDPLKLLGQFEGTHILFIFSSYISLMIHVLSWGFVLILSYLFSTKSLRDQSVFQNKTMVTVIVSFVMINLFLTVMGYLSIQIIVDRYLVAMCLVLLLFVPIGLSVLFADWKISIRTGSFYQPAKVLFPVTILLIFIMIVSAIYPFGPSHRYVNEAANWVKKNIPANSVFYSNTPLIPMLARTAFWENSIGWQKTFFNLLTEQQKEESLLRDKPLANGYAIFMVNHTEIAYRSMLIKILGQPIKIFHNAHQDSVLIFSTSPHYGKVIKN